MGETGGSAGADGIRYLRVPYALAVHGDAERAAVLQVLDQHSTIMGKRTKSFEARVAALFGKRFGVMVNSGSSANLLAVQVLGLPAGSEVVTPALTFSTTVAPLVQSGLVPALVDSELGSYQVELANVEEQIGEKTRALMIPNLLGNLPDLAGLRDLADTHGLLYIEDSCDTLGATFEGRPTGSYADVSTTSFYGSHVITAAGGGGMAVTDDEERALAMRVLRGWGRRSSGMEETEDVGERFAESVDGIPYDAKFVFDAVGYNFLPLELSAAFGEAQLDSLAGFNRTRRVAFERLRRFFARWEEVFVLPHERTGVETSWLAFPLTLREGAPFPRREIMTWLERAGIQTRTLFAGNLLRHPGFQRIHVRPAPRGYPVADFVMERSFVVGCHHGLTEEQLAHIEGVAERFLRRYA